MRRYRTALVGFGRIGAGYADDPRIARHYRFASHVQALDAHPLFAWEAVIDPDPEAQKAARRRNVAHVASSFDELLVTYSPEIVVLATPPSDRLQAVSACPDLRAVLCEKPMGSTPAESAAFLEHCEGRDVLVQVNYWRRCDELFARLASGYLAELVGQPRIVNAIYGNGLRNNGSHVIDTCRMLFGEVDRMQVLGDPTASVAFPLKHDLDVSCHLRFTSGATAVLQPLDFRQFREVAFEIWGDSGRVDLLNEGLTVRAYQRGPHRALSDDQEIAFDTPRSIATTVGDALYQVYDNLAGALARGEPLRSPGRSALQTETIVEQIFRAAGSPAPAP